MSDEIIYAYEPFGYFQRRHGGTPLTSQRVGVSGLQEKGSADKLSVTWSAHFIHFQIFSFVWSTQ